MMGERRSPEILRIVFCEDRDYNRRVHKAWQVTKSWEERNGDGSSTWGGSWEPPVSSGAPHSRRAPAPVPGGSSTARRVRDWADNGDASGRLCQHPRLCRGRG